MKIDFDPRDWTFGFWWGNKGFGIEIGPIHVHWTKQRTQRVTGVGFQPRAMITTWDEDIDVTD